MKLWTKWNKSILEEIMKDEGIFRKLLTDDDYDRFFYIEKQIQLVKEIREMWFEDRYDVFDDRTVDHQKFYKMFEIYKEIEQPQPVQQQPLFVNPGR